MELKLEEINEIKTDDVLYDIKLNQMCVYPNDVDILSLDKEYIFKNCLKIAIKTPLSN